MSVLSQVRPPTGEPYAGDPHVFSVLATAEVAMTEARANGAIRVFMIISFEFEDQQLHVKRGS
jgi:hypothetical protein